MAPRHYEGADQEPSAQDRQQLHLLLADPKFQRAVAAYNHSDDEQDVAYLAGSSDDGLKVFFDKDFVRAIENGEVTLNGQRYDPRPFIHIHEAVEGAILHGEFTPGIWQLKGDRFEAAHRLGLLAERYAVDEGLGPKFGRDVWPAYIKSTEKFIKPDTPQAVPEPPPDIMREGDEKQAGARAEIYHRVGRDVFSYVDEAEGDERCANCRYFRPSSNDGCHLYYLLNEKLTSEFDLEVKVAPEAYCKAHTT